VLAHKIMKKLKINYIVFSRPLKFSVLLWGGGTVAAKQNPSKIKVHNFVRSEQGFAITSYSRKNLEIYERDK
jgi:hypothetical protein